MKFQLVVRILSNVRFTFIKLQACIFFPQNFSYIIFLSCSKSAILSKFASAAELINTPIFWQGHHENMVSAPQITSGFY